MTLLIIQERLPKGATIAPLILASDKTTLTRFRGDKSAWPVYITIGNIKKDIRRKPSEHGTILVGYLPISKMTHIKDEESRRAGRCRLFHDCMRQITEPLIKAGQEGVEMVCADTKICRVHPILAAYVADHPEQCLITCCKENACPQCTVPPNRLGEHANFRHRDHAETKTTLERHANGEDPHLFDDLHMRAVPHPFWADLPYTYIFSCITPDILHQLHKGVFKEHLMTWCTHVMSETELDNRFKAMSQFSSLRHFKQGISTVKQWTGTEHKEMQRVFLAVIAGAVDIRLFKAARAVLDFIYYAEYYTHTDTTLIRMQDALNIFHADKSIFIELDIRQHFNIPKIHSMQHYIPSIRNLGSADGYNSESPERLHIDFAKDAYKASSRVDYISQMTHWLEIQEAVYRHSAYIRWVEASLNGAKVDDLDDSDVREINSEFQSHSVMQTLLPQFRPSGVWKNHGYRVAKNTPYTGVSVARLQSEFGAVDFIPAFQTFLNTCLPASSLRASELDKFNLYSSMLVLLPPASHSSDLKRINKVRAHPTVKNHNPRKQPLPAHFDCLFAVENLENWRMGKGFDGNVPLFYLFILLFLILSRPACCTSTCHFQVTKSLWPPTPPTRLHRMVPAFFKTRRTDKSVPSLARYTKPTQICDRH